MTVRKSSPIVVVAAFVVALTTSGVLTPVLFVSAAHEQESVPGVGIFGAFTPFAILLIPPFVLAIGIISHRVARSGWSVALITGAVGGLFVIASFFIVEWLR